MKILIVFILCVSCSTIKKIKEADLKSYIDKRSRKIDFLNIAWAKNLDPSYSSGNRPIGFSSPTIHDDVVYVGSLSGKFYAFNAQTGAKIWMQDEKQPLNAKASIFKDSIIYGSMYGRLFSRDVLTSKINYSIDLGAPIESAPLVYDGKLFIHLRNHKIVALDAESGKIFWTYQRSIPFKITLQKVSRPMAYKNKIIVGFADGFLVSLTQLEGVVAWETQLSKASKFVDVDLTPMIFNNRIVAGSAAGKLSFLNPETGFITKAINIIAGHTPVKIGNELFVGSIFGEVYRLDKSGEIKAKKKISDNAISSIVSWKDNIAISTMGPKLYVLSPYDLKDLQNWSLGTEVSSTFGKAVTNSEVMSIYSSRNRIYTFRSF